MGYQDKNLQSQLQKRGGEHKPSPRNDLLHPTSHLPTNASFIFLYEGIFNDLAMNLLSMDGYGGMVE